MLHNMATHKGQFILQLSTTIHTQPHLSPCIIQCILQYIHTIIIVMYVPVLRDLEGGRLSQMSTLIGGWSVVAGDSLLMSSSCTYRYQYIHV